MNIIDSFNGPNRWLSNFYTAKVVYDDVEYSSVENAYQASKTLDKTIRNEIKFVSPAEAKRIGRRIDLRPNWDTIKLHIMWVLVMQKFTRHPDLAAKLIATGNCLIVEGNEWGDTYWGVCNGHGYNHLGLILMGVRSLIIPKISD